MEYETAVRLLDEIRRTRLKELECDLVDCAVRYARIRTDWHRLSSAERAREDPARTLAHNALINACNILSRNMIRAGEDAAWRDRLGQDRRHIGDFACFLHCRLGIEAR